MLGEILASAELRNNAVLQVLSVLPQLLANIPETARLFLLHFSVATLSDDHFSVATLSDDHFSVATLSDDHFSVATLSDDHFARLSAEHVLREEIATASKNKETGFLHFRDAETVHVWLKKENGKCARAQLTAFSVCPSYFRVFLSLVVGRWWWWEGGGGKHHVYLLVWHPHRGKANLQVYALSVCPFPLSRTYALSPFPLSLSRGVNVLRGECVGVWRSSPTPI